MSRFQWPGLQDFVPGQIIAFHTVFLGHGDWILKDIRGNELFVYQAKVNGAHVWIQSQGDTHSYDLSFAEGEAVYIAGNTIHLPRTL